MIVTLRVVARYDAIGPATTPAVVAPYATVRPQGAITTRTGADMPERVIV